jgi:hypothetical protein
MFRVCCAVDASCSYMGGFVRAAGLLLLWQGTDLNHVYQQHTAGPGSCCYCAIGCYAGTVGSHSSASCCACVVCVMCVCFPALPLAKKQQKVLLSALHRV